MTTPLVLTFVGDDRPGLVNAISEKVAACRRDLAREPVGAARGQIRRRGAGQRSRRSAVAAGIVAARSRARRAARSRSSAARAAEAEKPARIVRLGILGNERPGIVRDVTQALTRLGVNIEEFSSGLESEPFTGVEMFRADRAPERPRGP